MIIKKFEDYLLLEKENIPEDETIEYARLMGRLLHLYGNIPVPKHKATEVINKIILATQGKFHVLGEDTEIKFQAPHDKVRFKDYFDSLIESKDVRGHNFEGTIAGIYGGVLAESRSAKWDVMIADRTYSVKFVDNSSKAPEIGKFRDRLVQTKLKETIDDFGGLKRIYDSHDRNMKEEIWSKVISDQITGGWIIAYPSLDNKTIQINILDLRTMRNFLFDGNAVSPKGGLKDFYSLAISARYKNFAGVKKAKIIIPEISLEELKKLNKSEEEEKWAEEIFGVYGYKIRPDVLRYIKKNANQIGKRLLRFDDY